MAGGYHHDPRYGLGVMFNANGQVTTVNPAPDAPDCCYCSRIVRCCTACSDVLGSNGCAIPVSVIMCIFCACCCPCLTCNDIPVYRSLTNDGKCPDGSLPSCCCPTSTPEEEWKTNLQQSHTYVYYSGNKTYGCTEEMFKTKKGKEISVIFLENFPRSRILDNLNKEIASSHLIVFKNEEMQNWKQTFASESDQARVNRAFEQSEHYQQGIQIEEKIRAVGASNEAKEQER